MPRPRSVDDDAILAATARALSLVGPARLTLADVAREVGLAPATLVQRFATKRGLLLALAAQGPPTVERQLAEACASARAGERPALTALINALIRLTGELSHPRAMANHLAFLQMDLRDPAFGAYAVAHAQALRRGVEALLDEAVTLGELQPTDTAALAKAIQVAYNGALVTWAIEPEPTLSACLRSELQLALASSRPHG